MMDSINQVLILTLMMVVGIYATKKGYMDERVRKGLSDILVNVTLPLMIIYSFMIDYDSSIIDKAVKIAIYAFVIMIVSYIFAKVVFSKTDESKKPSMIFAIVFTNCAFMGYPVLSSIYGDIGVFYVSIYNMAFTALVWSLGVSIFAGKMSVKDSVITTIKNPSMVAVAIGLVLFFTQLKLPYVISEVFKTVGGLTTPISMFIIGSMLCGSNIKTIFKDKCIWLLILFSQVVTPLIVFAVMIFFGADQMLTGICTLLVAMPAAALTAVIAVDTGANGKFASECVFATTLFSIITIPAFMMLVAM